jgi:hypothetical protein
MPKYLFRLERLHVDFQRGKVGDVYSSTFGVEIGAKSIGPIGRVIGSSALTIESGRDIDFSTLPPDNPVGKWGTWDIGPVEVGPDDIVAIDYVFVNTSDKLGMSKGDQTKIVITSWTSITGVGIAAATGAETAGNGAVVGAVVAGVGAVVAELVGDILDSNTPKCNGVAFADKVVLNAAEIAQGTNNPDNKMFITRNSTNPDIPSDCGHPSSGDITTSVTLVLSESVRHFLGTKGDLSNGIKKGLKLSSPLSLRSLIEA